LFLSSHLEARKEGVCCALQALGDKLRSEHDRGHKGKHHDGGPDDGVSKHVKGLVVDAPSDVEPLNDQEVKCRSYNLVVRIEVSGLGFHAGALTIN
jgi:hypothetical protein